VLSFKTENPKEFRFSNLTTVISEIGFFVDLYVCTP
jgi:hypothetical protein